MGRDGVGHPADSPVPDKFLSGTGGGRTPVVKKIHESKRLRMYFLSHTHRVNGFVIYRTYFKRIYDAKNMGYPLCHFLLGASGEVKHSTVMMACNASSISHMRHAACSCNAFVCICFSLRTALLLRCEGRLFFPFFLIPLVLLPP